MSRIKTTLLVGALCALVSPMTQAQTRFSVIQDQGEWVVRDAKTALTWRLCPEGMTTDGRTCSGGATPFTWAQALANGSTVTPAQGRRPWRVPNIKELSSIADRSRSAPALYSIFPDASSSDFWSDTPAADDADRSRYVTFFYGNAYTALRASAMNLRLVRSGD